MFNPRRFSACVPVALALWGASQRPALAEPVQMVLGIFGQLPSSSRSAIPGAVPTSMDVGSLPDPRFTNFGVKLFRSPTSNQWITVATTNQTPGAVDQMLVIGSGLFITGGQVAAREGVTATGGGDLLNFSGLSIPRINDSGQWALSYQPAGGSAATQRIAEWDGAALTTAFQNADVVSAGGGTTLFGSFNFGGSPVSSALISNSGAVTFLASTSAGNAVLGANGAVMLIAIGTDAPASQAGGGAAPWTSVSAFTQDAAANHLLALGKVGTDTTQDLVVVVDGVVQIQKGSVLAGSGFSSPVATIADAFMESNGDWYARGGNSEATPTFWLVKNGQVIAVSGQPIVPGSSEHWKVGSSSPFIDVHGNNAGNYVVVGNTDNTTATQSAVVVLNGIRVIARASDAVDVGDGVTPAGSLFLHTPFQANGVFNNDGYYYFFSRLKATAAGTAGAGTSPNNASILRVKGCPADYNGSGAVSVQDIFDFLAGWFAGDIRADFNRSGTIGVQDIFDFLAEWFTGC